MTLHRSFIFHLIIMFYILNDHTIQKKKLFFENPSQKKGVTNLSLHIFYTFTRNNESVSYIFK